MALPRSPGPKTEVRMARLVPKIIAAEMPWKIRNIIRDSMFHEKIIRNVDNVKRDIPYVNIFFLTTISASLPKGRRNITHERIKLLAIQPSSIAVVLKSPAIEGRARLIA
jgi:hypothetical protein